MPGPQQASASQEIINPHTGQPVEWAPFNNAVTVGKSYEFEDLLRRAGLWDGFTTAPRREYDGAYRGQDDRYMDAQQDYENTDWARLNGYTSGYSRKDYYVTGYLRDPSGNIVAETDPIYSPGSSLRRGDYAQIASVLGGALVGGLGGASGVGNSLYGLSGTQGAMAGGATIGAVGGGVQARLTGQNVLRGAVTGGLMGGAGGYLSSQFAPAAGQAIDPAATGYDYRNQIDMAPDSYSAANPTPSDSGGLQNYAASQQTTPSALNSYFNTGANDMSVPNGQSGYADAIYGQPEYTGTFDQSMYDLPTTGGGPADATYSTTGSLPELQAPSSDLLLNDRASMPIGPGSLPASTNVNQPIDVRRLIGQTQTAIGAAGAVNQLLNGRSGSGGTGGSGMSDGANYTDAMRLAELQAQSQRDLIDQQTLANRANQNNPFGSSSWTRDPTTGQWTNNVTLNPALQGTLTNQQNTDLQRSQLANGLMGRVGNSFGTEFNPASISSFMGGVNAVNQNSLGRAGQFNTNARIDTNAPTAQGLNANFGQFSGNGSNIITDAPQFQGTGQDLDTSQMGWQNNGAQGLNQDLMQSGAYTNGVQDLNQNFDPSQAGVNAVDQNAPQFTQGMRDQYAKAAYDSQMALMRDDMNTHDERVRNSLILQGLTPGTEASTRALTSLENGRANQLNSLSNSSLLTGSQLANQDYSSMLNGFNARNAAQNQAFGQAQGVFNTNNQARTQALSNALSRYSADLTGRDSTNAARSTAFNQDATRNNFDLNAQQSANNAKNMAFTQSLGAYGANLQGMQAANTARGQAFNQDLAGFNANQSSQLNSNNARSQDFANALQSYQASNQAQGQQFAMDSSAYDNRLRGLQTDAGLQQSENAAQQQAYNQGMNNYSVNYQDYLSRRNMPLQELNALNNGTQVQMPQFNNYIGAQAGNGTNYLGAGQLGAQQQQNANQNQASQYNMWGNLLGAGASLWGSSNNNSGSGSSGGGWGSLFSNIGNWFGGP